MLVNGRRDVLVKAKNVFHEEQFFSQYIEIGWGGDKQYSCIDRTCVVHVIMFISKNLVNISDKQVKEYRT